MQADSLTGIDKPEIRVAIVDDELHCIEGLVLHLKSLFPEIRVVFKENKPEEAVTKLQSAKIDLLFLDVEMPAINGFELLEMLPDFEFDVIFTTAYSQYAIRAFKAKAVNYLLKPIDDAELKEAILQWKNERESRNAAASNKMTELFELLKREGILKNKIAVSVSDGFEFVEIEDILYCQSQNNYTFIYLKDGRKVTYSKTLKEFEGLLDKYYFLRIHKSYLINPNYIRKYFRNDGGSIEMQDGRSIPVSRHKKDLITNLFEAVSKGL